MLGGVGELRRPEYTGENRCLPCTVLNLFVGATVSAALGAVVSPGVGGLAFGVFAVVIYLRGYLIPGTPAITARYVPRWLLELFGKEPRAEPRAETGTEPLAEIDDMRVLKASRAVERAEADGLRLRPAFRTAWNGRIRELRGTNIESERVADLLGVKPNAVSGVGENSYAISNERLVQWASDAALLADVAAGQELRTRCPNWNELDTDEITRLLARLRAVRDQCPGCDEQLSTSERTVTSCCRPSTTITSVQCDGCGALIAETHPE